MNKQKQANEQITKGFERLVFYIENLLSNNYEKHNFDNKNEMIEYLNEECSCNVLFKNDTVTIELTYSDSYNINDITLIKYECNLYDVNYSIKLELEK